jgi:tetratricopeptide (TPR) repeat protein
MIKIVIVLSFLISNAIFAQTCADFDSIGSKMEQVGNFRGAVINYEKALRLEPNNIDILEKLYFAKCNLSKDRRALDEISKLISLRPASSKFYFLRGFTHFELKNYERAIADYTQAINNQEDKISNFTIFSERGLCKMRIKDYKGALADFNQSLSIYPNPGILKYKKEAEDQIKKQDSKIKYKAVPVSAQHILFNSSKKQ